MHCYCTAVHIQKVGFLFCGDQEAEGDTRSLPQEIPLVTEGAAVPMWALGLRKHWHVHELGWHGYPPSSSERLCRVTLMGVLTPPSWGAPTLNYEGGMGGHCCCCLGKVAGERRSQSNGSLRVTTPREPGLIGGKKINNQGVDGHVMSLCTLGQ